MFAGAISTAFALVQSDKPGRVAAGLCLFALVLGFYVYCTIKEERRQK